MKRFIPGAFCLTGAVLLALCAGKQAQLMSDAPGPRAAEAAAAAAPFVFFAGTSVALLTVSAACVADRWEA